MQTGLIGYLRADFGSTGKEFYSTWNDFRKDLKTDDFKKEFDLVINSYRFGDGEFLSGRSAMTKFCYEHPESSYEDDRNHCGVRVDTEQYSYLMRLNPNRGEYNLYCYCYQREWLDNHLQKAEKGIRFIDPHYKEQFTIPDGDKIRITLSSGEHYDRECRYIDDYHLEVGDNLYHICEFAERLEKTHGSVIPLRSSLPPNCFSILPSSGELIVITRGEKGYLPSDMQIKGKSNQEVAEIANHASGVTKAQEAAMLAGSMFGWQTPAADPKNYDEQGQPIKPRQKDRGEAR